MKIKKLLPVILACSIALTSCGKQAEKPSESLTGESEVTEEALEDDSKETSIQTSSQEGTNESSSSGSDSSTEEELSTADESAWADKNALYASAREWTDTGVNQNGTKYEYSNFEAMNDQKWVLSEFASTSETQKHDIETFSLNAQDSGAPENMFSAVLSGYEDSLSSEEYLPAADTDLQSVHTYSGHKIYVSNNGVEGRYIFSTSEYWPILLGTNDSIPAENEALLFEEGSPLRVYVFKSQSELDGALKQWEEGQAILSGESEELDGRVILNGRLLPESISFERVEDVPYVSYSALASEYNKSSTVTSVTKQLMYQDYFQGMMVVPSQAILKFEDDMSLSAMYGFDIDKGKKTCTYSSYEFKIPTTDKFEMSTNDIANISGWDIYYDGTMLNIVTSKYEATNNFVLKK